MQTYRKSALSSLEKIILTKWERRRRRRYWWWWLMRIKMTMMMWRIDDGQIRADRWMHETNYSFSANLQKWKLYASKRNVKTWENKNQFEKNKKLQKILATVFYLSFNDGKLETSHRTQLRRKNAQIWNTYVFVQHFVLYGCNVMVWFRWHLFWVKINSWHHDTMEVGIEILQLFYFEPFGIFLWSECVFFGARLKSEEWGIDATIERP